MKIKFIKYLGDLGVKKDYTPWEAHLTRKLNFSTLLGFTNVLLAMLTFISVGYMDSVPECLVVLIIAPLVPLLNVKYGYKVAAYLFIFVGCFLFYFLCVKMGQDSLAFLCYLPLIVGTIQMMARKEMFYHMIVMLAMCLGSMILVLFSYHANLFEVKVSPSVINVLKYVNIFFSFFTTIGFLIIISKESIRQETLLKSAILQKETLLAELFHRVKNNLNIVNSLLNLKKGSVQSAEAQQALEECRSLIFSMSLVHNKIYNQDKIDNLNFGEYLHDLGKDLVNSLGGKETKLLVNAPKVSFDITHAIPCGLIINELMTNSFKHGRVSGKQLQIQIDLETSEDRLTLSYRDNGPGINAQKSDSGSAGIGLIKSLAEQLDGNYNFVNNGGMRFSISFPYNVRAFN